MKRFLMRVRDAGRMVRGGHGGRVLRALRSRLWSRSTAYGLRRDLTRPFAAPQARMALEVRPLAPDDDLSFLDTTGPDVTPEAAYTRLAQQRLLQSGIPSCWVAAAPDGRLSYMQWLVAAHDDGKVHAHFGDLFPRLGPQEALLEGAYTVEDCRGRGIMAHAMARIAEGARALGARWVVTFVEEDNVASLKGCQKAGFEPYLRRRESWLLFRRRVDFVPLPAGSALSFDH